MDHEHIADELAELMGGWQVVDVSRPDRTEAYFSIELTRGDQRRSFVFHATELGAWTTNLQTWDDGSLPTYDDVDTLIGELYGDMADIRDHENRIYRTDDGELEQRDGRSLEAIFDDHVTVVCEDAYTGFRRVDNDDVWLMTWDDLEDSDDPITPLFHSEKGLEVIQSWLGVCQFVLEMGDDLPDHYREALEATDVTFNR